jgi:DNA polymerase I-like protein with 3'-5' exonuclease and polymerase domains
MRDVQICEPCIDEETAKGYSLNVLANKYLGRGKSEELLRKAAATYTKGYKNGNCHKPIAFDSKSDLWMLPPQYVGLYAEADAELPELIYAEQKKIIDKEDLWQIINLESSLVHVLLRMRIRGVRIDLEQAEKLKKVLTIEIDKYFARIKDLVGFRPNLDSSQDMLKAYLALDRRYPELKIKESLVRTAPTPNYPDGNPSFKSEWYKEQVDPLSNIVSRTKKLLTLRDDFVIGDIIKEHVNGRLHSQFHPLRQDDRGTRSGRFSSTNPNLQQVPSRHDDEIWDKDDPIWSEEVRKLFIPEDGERWLKADFSQQEPRFVVHFASKAKLPGVELAVQAFRRNPLTDYHQLTTDIVNHASGRNYKRKRIKGINLGIAYGMGLDKLCRQLGVSIEEGKEMLAEYHAALPFIKGLSNKCTEVANDRGYILTVLKRRRRFNLWEPMSKSKIKWRGLPYFEALQRWPEERLRRFGTHKAMNALAQGSSADQTKEAMRILYYDHGIVPSLQVHDELTKSVKEVEEAKIIKRTMETCIILVIPVVCEATLGSSWGSAKEVVHL